MSETRLADERLCPSCDLPHGVLMKNIWISQPVCAVCTEVWYGEGFTDARQIRNESRVRQGRVMETYEP